MFFNNEHLYRISEIPFYYKFFLWFDLRFIARVNTFKITSFVQVIIDAVVMVYEKVVCSPNISHQNWIVQKGSFRCLIAGSIPRKMTVVRY